jgi:hypothetical protein
MPTPHVRTLKRALEVVGTKTRLAVALEMTESELEDYLNDRRPLPTDKFIEALDIVSHGKL